MRKSLPETDFDLAIIGAGPAGAAAAYSLPAGVSIVHLDKAGPAREKLCSGLLTIEAQNSLKKLFGTDELPPDVAASPDIDTLRFIDLDNGTAMSLSVGYRNMHRALFDRWLLSKVVRAGYTQVWGASVTGVSRRSGVYAVDYLLESRTESLSAKYVIDASGWAAVSRSPNGHDAPRRRFALQTVLPFETALEFRAFFHEEHTDWFGWTVPKAGATLAGIGFRVEDVKIGGNGAAPPGAKDGKDNKLAAFARFLKFLHVRGYLPFDELPSPDRAQEVKAFHKKYPVKGSPISAITNMRQVFMGAGGLFIAGEAAGLVSPSSGDGISFGLASGIALGEVFARIHCEGRMGRGNSFDDQRLYRDILSPELRELRFNIQKANIMAHPNLRHAAAHFLAWHNGMTMERVGEDSKAGK